MRFVGKLQRIMFWCFPSGRRRLRQGGTPRSAWAWAALCAGVAISSVFPHDIGAETIVRGTSTPTELMLRLDSFDGSVDALLGEMTLAEKVGQMTQADLSSLKDYSEVRSLCLGSVLSGGNSDPPTGNTLEDWTNAYEACQREALQTRLKVPILYGVDAVHGHNNVLGAVIYPHNIGLGCANDPKLVEQIGRLTALDLRATGIQWAFAPCVAVPRDDRWGRTFEGFSEDPGRVSRLGAALVRGLQGGDLGRPTSVLACGKHFLGDGGTTAEVRDSGSEELDAGERMRLDQGDTRCDEQTLRRIHLTPYLSCLEQGLGSVMPSFSSWNGVKCSARKDLITDLLKGELGFEGIVVSDWSAISQCHSDYKQAVRICINAGIDMAMEPTSYREFISALTELVEEGEVPIERIDDAVRRILRVKAALGMLDPRRDQLADRSLQPRVGSIEARALARQAVQKSLVVLKNQGVLPVSKSVKRIHVVGRAADDLGMQCGGWTIDWQGGKGEITTGGVTLLKGLREVAGQQVQVTYSKTADTPDDADLVVIAVGEEPYAEGLGDTDCLALDPSQAKLIERVRGSGKPTCLVIYSGRPLELSQSALDCEAIVAAWLPGTEGAGVADVLFGAAPATGTLSFTWPKSTKQQPINIGDTPYDCLYPLGHKAACASDAR